MGKLKAVAELFEGRHFDREVIILCVRVRFAPDSPLEGIGFEPSVPLLRKALLGVANRRRRHERRSHLQVQVCLEWLPIAFAFAEGPRVRIRLPPASESVSPENSGAGAKSRERSRGRRRSDHR